MTASLGGLDVLVFTGGIGEHQPGLRARTVEGLSFLGVAMEAQANARAFGDADVSAAGAAGRVVVVTAREDLQIARLVRATLDPVGSGDRSGGRPAAEAGEPADEPGRPPRRNPRRNPPPGRRSLGPRSDDEDVTQTSTAAEDPRSTFLAFYDDALPQVYGYLSARCGLRVLAEDLTAETFLAAVDAVRRDDPPPVSMPWIIGVARHKLVDHWRRQAREDRGLRAVGTGRSGSGSRRPLGRLPRRRAGPRDPRRAGPAAPGRADPSLPRRSARPRGGGLARAAPCTPPRPCSSGPGPRSARPTARRRSTMADPFDALRGPGDPRRPGRHLRRPPALPRGAGLRPPERSDRVADRSDRRPAVPERAGPRGSALTPYLAVAGADRALDWYAEAFGARRRGEPIVMPDGRIGHAELEIAGGAADALRGAPRDRRRGAGAGPGGPRHHPPGGRRRRRRDRAGGAGGRRPRPAGGRLRLRAERGHPGSVRPPLVDLRPGVGVGAGGEGGGVGAGGGGGGGVGAGGAAVSGPAAGRRPLGRGTGDIGYVSLWLPDVDRAAVFYAAVLGWRYGPGSGPGRPPGARDRASTTGCGEERRTAPCSCASRSTTSTPPAGGYGRPGARPSAPHDEPYGPYLGVRRRPGRALRRVRAAGRHRRRGPRAR